MDHKAFLSALPAGERSVLTTKEDAPGLRHAALHFGLILSGSAYITAGLPLWWLLLPVQGILLIFLFTLLHETVHDTPFATIRLNRVFGHISGFLVMIPAGWFRYFHLAHHKHTNDPDHDPELMAKKPQTRREYMIHVSGLTAWRSNIRSLWRNAFGNPAAAYLPGSVEPRVRFEARIYLMLYAVTALLLLWGQSWVFWCWALPVFLGQPFLRLYLLAEHGHCPPVANMFENTRTTFTGRIVRFLAWNMPYHAEHHAMPTVPFHQLPKLHSLCAPHLKSTSDGYNEFHKDYRAGLRP